MWPRRRRKNLLTFHRGTEAREEGETATPDTDLHHLLNLKPYVNEERDRYDNTAVLAALKTNPSAAAAKYEFTGMRGWRQYPLKRAVALGASLDVVRRMAAAHPDAIRERGMPGMSGSGVTALHAACTYGAPLEVVRFLATRYPEALEMTTRHGYLPLHNACERGASADVVRLLVEMHPAALDRRNKLNRTPAECAVRAEGGAANEEVMAALAYAPPVSIRALRSFEGWLGMEWVTGKKAQRRCKSWSGNRQSMRTAKTQGLDDSRPEDSIGVAAYFEEENDAGSS